MDEGGEGGRREGGDGGVEEGGDIGGSGEREEGGFGEEEGAGGDKGDSGADAATRLGGGEDLQVLVEDKGVLERRDVVFLVEGGGFVSAGGGRFRFGFGLL